MKSFSLEVQVDHIFSENNYLEPRAMKVKGTQRWRAYLYKPDPVKKYQDIIRLSVIDQMVKLGITLEGKPKIKMSTFFMMRGNYVMRDTGNCLKLYEDGLKAGLSVDDRFTVTHVLTKVDYSKADDSLESIITFVEVMDEN